MTHRALSDEELERYQRQIILPEIGGAGQTALANSHVIMVGAGGIGCPVLLSLVSAGIGTISIYDGDNIALHNLHRQTLFGPDDIGTAKAKAAQKHLRRLNPNCNIIVYNENFTAQHSRSINVQETAMIIDGTDSFMSRLAINDAAVCAGVPLLSAAIGRFQGQIGTFAGHRSDSPCYRCFVGDAFDSDDCDTCAEQGILGPMAAMIGHFAALEAVRLITGFGTSTFGRLHILDGIKPALRTISIRKDPKCRTCGTQKNGE